MVMKPEPIYMQALRAVCAEGPPPNRGARPGDLAHIARRRGVQPGDGA